MKRYLFYLAAISWIMALAVHLLSIIDFDVDEKLPFVRVLHIGIFIILLSTMFDLKIKQDFQEYRQQPFFDRLNPIASSKIPSKKVPTWLGAFAVIGVVYNCASMIQFMNAQMGQPAISDGKFILQNHGNFIRTITEAEYHHYKANILRYFSGFWITFYGLFTAILYPYKNV